jgi:hypothetical protein
MTLPLANFWQSEVNCPQMLMDIPSHRAAATAFANVFHGLSDRFFNHNSA